MFSDKVKNLSNTVLLVLMLMAVYSHYMVNDKFERVAPALVSIYRYCEKLLYIHLLKAANCEMFLGILFYAYGTTGNRLAVETRGHAICNSKRRRW